MKISDILVSGLNITEDEYDYKGMFFLSNEDKSLQVELADIQKDEKILEIKKYFHLEENIEEIRHSLMEKIVEKASISSRMNEGENYEEKVSKGKIEKLANTFNMS